MKRLVGSFALVLLCASIVYAGPNAVAKIVATLDKTSGVKAGDTVTLSLGANGLNSCSGFTAEVLYNFTALEDPQTAAVQPFLAPGKQTEVFTTLTGYNRRTWIGAAQLGATTTNAGLTPLATFAFVAKAGFTNANIAIRYLVLNSGTLRDTIKAVPNPMILAINGGSYIEAIPGDIDLDGDVDFEDFFILAANFGRKGPIPASGVQTIIQTVTVHDTVNVAGVRYTNTFDDSSSVLTWIKGRNGTWKIQGSRLFLAGGTTGFIMQVTSSQTFSGDIDMTADTEWMKGVDDNEYGVIFRSNSIGNYGFAISGNGYYTVAKWKLNGTTLQRERSDLKDWTQSSLIKQRGKNQLRVVTSGSLMSFYINGGRVEQITDGDFKTGNVALYVGDVQEVAFDNVTVTETTITQPLLLKKPVVVNRASE